MAKFKQQQFTFSTGEIDPLLIARSDLDRYFASAETMLNVLPLPQGGFERCHGLEYIDELNHKITRVTSGVTITAPEGGTPANANDNDESTLLTTTTAISTINPYVVVHYDLGSAKTIKYADILNFDITDSANIFEFFIQYSDDDATWTSLGDQIPTPKISETGSKSRRRTGPVTARYWRFARIGSTDNTTAVASISEFALWEEISELSESRLAYFNFAIDQRYLLLFTDYNVGVYKNGVLQTNVQSAFSSDQMQYLDWTHQQDALICVHEDVAPQILQRQGTDDAWQMQTIFFDELPTYRFQIDQDYYPPSGTLTPSAVDGEITLTSTGTFSFIGLENQHIEGNGGYVHIIEVIDALNAKANVEIPFFDTSTIPNGEWFVLTYWEPAWSTTWGWPKTVAIHDSRLWFGGSKSLPSNIWGSRIDDYFNFSSIFTLDDEGIDIQIEADESPEIVALYSGRDFQIFCTTHERYIPQNNNATITPTNVLTKQGSGRGSKAGLRPQAASGLTMFMQAEGKAVRDLVFVDTEQSYTAPAISTFSSHLLKNPRDMVIRKATSTTEADLLVIVNDDDGSLAIMSRIRDQNVAGWVPRETTGASGKFLQCGIDGSNIYFVVERTINGATVRYLEKFSSDALLDCSVVGTVGASTTTITGLDHLEGETVSVIVDDYVQTDQVVSGGQITVDAFSESYQVGLNFTPQVVTIPISQQLQDGTILGRRKRIVETVLELQDTVNITVNGNEVPFRSFGSGASSPLDAPITPFTGRKTVEGLLGWSENGQITISQSVPAKMLVKAIELKVQI